MAARNRSIFGLYSTQADAENAVNSLKLAGFRNTDISLLFPENEGSKDLALARRSKAPEGAAVGSCCGVVVGGAIGWLIGAGLLASAGMTAPGLSMFVVAGPIVSMLSGIGAGGVLGGLIGALAGLTSPEYEAKRYAGRIHRGGILMSVHCDDSNWLKTAQMMLRQTGAEGVSAASEAKADFAASDRPRPRTIEWKT